MKNKEEELKEVANKQKTEEIRIGRSINRKKLLTFSRKQKERKKKSKITQQETEEANKDEE